MLLKIITHLFPEKPALEDFQGNDTVENTSLITDNELTKACARLENNKAQNSDVQRISNQ